MNNTTALNGRPTGYLFLLKTFTLNKCNFYTEVILIIVAKEENQLK